MVPRIPPCSRGLVGLQLLSVGGGKDACRLIEGIIIGGIQYEPQAPAPNTALAIYQHGKAASELLDASPLRFVLEVNAQGDAVAPAHDLGATQQAPDMPVRNTNQGGVEVGPEDLERRGGGPEIRENTESSEWGFMARYPPHAPDPKAEGEEGQKKAASQASPSPQPELPPPPPSNANAPPPHILRHREFQLTISRSHLNHQAYIERQAYYGSFNPDTRSIMAEDLESRVPLKGLADCKLGKEEVPLRIRQKRKEKDAEREWVGLKGLWEMGQREK